jgi:hypothetical protein
MPHFTLAESIISMKIFFACIQGNVQESKIVVKIGQKVTIHHHTKMNDTNTKLIHKIFCN